MSNLVQVDFHAGRTAKGERVGVSAVIGDLKQAQENLKRWPVDRIIELFDEFGFRLMDRRLSIHGDYPNSGIAYIAGWCRKSNLVSLLQSAFQSRYVLDRFVDSEAKTDRSYRAHSRGLVVHWMAGNVPTLGFLSLIQGVLTKNANLIKPASGSNDLLAQLLFVLSTAKEGEPQSGRDLVKSMAVVRYDRNRKDIGAAISKEADVRVFWGGDDSVATMRALPTKLHTRDLVFSNKTSFMAIDNGSLETMDMEAIARRVAMDISVFEQKACASPHTLFLETEDASVVQQFALCLKEALSRALASIPKTIPSQNEISAVLNLRAQYDMFHQAWYSEGTEFSILSDDYFQLGPPIGNRTIYLRKIDNLQKLTELITPQVQSVGILAKPETFERVTALFSEKGVHRFTNIGAITHFEVPWDGYILPQYLVRWTSRPKQS
ncbi:MAG: hypothetical protein JRJ38_04830 [Deltaproteobacteria bacterium]|nr:hypothetical protein [Deltaproteobacteria bacterium]